MSSFLDYDLWIFMRQIHCQCSFKLKAKHSWLICSLSKNPQWILNFLNGMTSRAISKTSIWLGHIWTVSQKFLAVPFKIISFSSQRGNLNLGAAKKWSSMRCWSRLGRGHLALPSWWDTRLRRRGKADTIVFFLLVQCIHCFLGFCKMMLPSKKSEKKGLFQVCLEEDQTCPSDRQMPPISTPRGPLNTLCPLWGVWYLTIQVSLSCEKGSIIVHVLGYCSCGPVSEFLIWNAAIISTLVIIGKLDGKCKMALDFVDLLRNDFIEKDCSFDIPKKKNMRGFEYSNGSNLFVVFQGLLLCFHGPWQTVLLSWLSCDNTEMMVSVMI